MDLILHPPVLLVLAAVVVTASALTRRLPAVRRRALARYGRRVDLPPPGEASRQRVEAALTRRNLAVDIGGSAGVASAAALGLLLGAPEGLPGATEAAREGLWALIVAGAALAGTAGGAAWSGIRETRRGRPVPGPRVARPTASTAADYVAPLELWGARAAGVAPALALLVGTVIATQVGTVAPGQLWTIGTVLPAASGLAVLAVAEVAGRRLLDLPQAAGSSLDLAWSDALRSRVLRDVVTAPLAIGLYATAALLTAASASVDDPVISNGLVGLVGLGIIGAAVLTLASVASRPQRHFRRRLWPRDGAPHPSVGPVGRASGLGR